MPNADDTLLLMGTKGLATRQIIEVQILQPDDGSYQLGLAEFDVLVFEALASTAQDIRDGLADQIVSPTHDPLVRKKIALDRFQVRGAPGDPFDYYLIPPNVDAAKVIVIQAASGAPTEVRAWYLGLAIELIKESFWGGLTQYLQVLLVGYFLESWIAAAAASDAMIVGGVASSLGLGPASVGLSGGAIMPSAASLATSTTYGQPLLEIMKARVGGPVWSGGG